VLWLLVALLFAVGAVGKGASRGVHGKPLPRQRPDVVSSQFHAFFYLWYGEPDTDSRWKHWNHSRLPHWNEGEDGRGKNGGQLPRHYFDRREPSPPESVHSHYYPHRGCYSSLNKKVLRDQLKELRDRAGVGVVVASWTGRPEEHQGEEERKELQTTDSQKINTDPALRQLLAAAEEVGVKVAIHLEPYHGRTAASVRRDIEYLHREFFAKSSAIYRYPRARRVQEEGKKEEERLPVVYIYDSYLIPSEDWADVLSDTGKNTVRGTEFDITALALLLKKEELSDVKKAGFDGVYTYFAAEGMSDASLSRQWKQLGQAVRAAGLMFSPSVGPGYDDTNIRPWNTMMKRDRRSGEYYHSMLASAISAQPDFVSITSYNEWGEGTQIEPARPRHDNSVVAEEDYSPGSPYKYLEITKDFVAKVVDGEDMMRAEDVGLEIKVEDAEPSSTLSSNRSGYQ